MATERFKSRIQFGNRRVSTPGPLAAEQSQNRFYSRRATLVAEGASSLRRHFCLTIMPPFGLPLPARLADLLGPAAAVCCSSGAFIASTC